jgi:hypothetical protein
MGYVWREKGLKLRKIRGVLFIRYTFQMWYCIHPGGILLHSKDIYVEVIVQEG